MSTTTCYACRSTVSTSATRCPHCTTVIVMGSGGDPNISYASSGGFGQWLGNAFILWLCGWLVWYHLGNYMGWR